MSNKKEKKVCICGEMKMLQKYAKSIGLFLYVDNYIHDKNIYEVFITNEYTHEGKRRVKNG